MRFGTEAQAAPTRFSRLTAGGQKIWRTEFYGPPPSPRHERNMVLQEAVKYVDPLPGEVREPQAFLVEQEPGAEVAAHFHYVDQFQVFVSGHGRIGTHAASPLTVQFAAAHTGYGPLVPGAEGMGYFTFRASADECGAQHLPEARARMKAVPRRNAFAQPIRPETPQERQRRTRSEVETALEASDGLGVYCLRMAPNDTLDAPTDFPGSSTWMLVVSGALHQAGQPLPAPSCLYVTSADGRVRLVSQAEGAEVLVLRFPVVVPTT